MSATITLAVAKTQLQLWIDADAATATGQSYSIGQRSLTRADAEEITEKIQYWSGIEAQLERQANDEPRVSVALASFNP
jgi:hypothetical protein